MSGFLDPDAFPDLAPILDLMRQRWATDMLMGEARAALERFSPSPEVYIQDANDIRLHILPVKWQGQWADQAHFAGDRAGAWRPRCTGAEMVAAAPHLCRLADSPWVVNAMYSLSLPGCEIVPHTDRVEAIGDVYRLHLGLFCPEGCGLQVGGEAAPWTAGGVLMFDSPRVTHAAWNRGGAPRLIAILDMDRAALDG